MTLAPIIVLALMVVGGLVFRNISRRRRRERLLATPLTDEQRQMLERLVPALRHLPPSLRPKLEGKINLFLDQVTFHAYQGLELRDEMRLSVAAQACLLIVNSPVWYETVRTVLLYPSTIRTSRNRDDGFVVHEGETHLAGESWTRGPVVLSWDHALKGGLDADDGHNVVMHEFAHQLDSLTGHTNGIPILRKDQSYAGWEKAMLDAYNDHVKRVENGHRPVIDPYGAINHQEFFAVATVTFFEKPRELKRDEPALYAQLAKLFALDPAECA
ncbi:M90 family metallopeptidase [Aurantiacibacter poecillastricola]|uniref:M90 family metallopeptidase n=1 Tax=Aurantiacibacter poecillastricola TaxID=3064385 RepID=UPI00273E5C45|nr:M90 family metallopeptidase [Aurantiacibacter sp. 219JJ12-13]MDP5262816.1 zinc-dependent peptidase [Aurantiacibacter sp. 219JJ12-13]